MNDLERFIVSRWMYSIGEPIISDEEYQLLYETVAACYPDNEYLTRTWSDDPCPVELLKRFGYAGAVKDIILTDKSESIPSIGDWSIVEAVYRDIHEDMTLSMKHDGWNIQAAYYNTELVNIQTRGRSHDAISAKVLESKIPKTISWPGKYTVAMEATVSNENYKRLKSELGAKSQRGAVSSCLARGEYTELIDLHAFSVMGEKQIFNPFPVLKQWGFNTPAWMLVKDYDSLLQGMNEFNELYKRYPSPTDGLVVKGTFARAIRLLSWEEPLHYSFVEGYEESFGMYRIGVKVKIFPVKMRNSTQSLVSVTNYQRVIDNNLRPGYPVAFRLASMSIADLDEDATRLLQEKWKGHYDEFASTIRRNEQIKSEI